MIKRYSIKSEYNKFACEDQIAYEEDVDGGWVKYEDVKDILATTFDFKSLQSSNVDLLIINPGRRMRFEDIANYIDALRAALDSWGMEHIRVILGNDALIEGDGKNLVQGF